MNTLRCALGTAALSLSLVAATALAQTQPASGTPATKISIADAKRGSMVVLSGRVDRLIDEDKFRLCDASDCIRIDTGDTMLPVNLDEEVTVTGFIDRDMLREVYAREIKRANGEVVPISSW